MLVNIHPYKFVTKIFFLLQTVYLSLTYFMSNQTVLFLFFLLFYLEICGISRSPELCGSNLDLKVIQFL